MNVTAIYHGSDGKQTIALYQALEAVGPAGLVAMNLFRAQKCSARAKVYSRRYKGEAYGRKQWSIANLVKVLAEHGPALGIGYGWKEDAAQPYCPWVIYIDLPTGQCSFHSPIRLYGPDYPGEWRQQSSEKVILEFVSKVFQSPACDVTSSQPDCFGQAAGVESR